MVSECVVRGSRSDRRRVPSFVEDSCCDVSCVIDSSVSCILGSTLSSYTFCSSRKPTDKQLASVIFSYKAERPLSV